MKKTMMLFFAMLFATLFLALDCKGGFTTDPKVIGCRASCGGVRNAAVAKCKETIGTDKSEDEQKDICDKAGEKAYQPCVDKCLKEAR